MARLLRVLHLVAGAILIATVMMGYGVRFGFVSVRAHVPWGFFLALIVAFPHAMTVFYFAGIGVSLREAAGRKRWAAAALARSEKLRRQVAVPLGLALVTLMAAVILGGGSHTRWLPFWVHHTAALMALAMTLTASHRARWAIAEQDRIVCEVEERMVSGETGMDQEAIRE